MSSPIERSREQITEDIRDFNTSFGAGAARGEVPIQNDLQVDEFDYPAVPAGGSAALPFAISNASTGGSTPAAKVQIAYGLFYAPSLGTSIDATLGGVSLTLGPTMTFGSAGTYAIYLASDLATYCTVNQAALGSVPSDNPSGPETYCILGVVTVSTSGSGLTVSSIQQAVTSSLSAVLCSNAMNFMWSQL